MGKVIDLHGGARGREAERPKAQHRVLLPFLPQILIGSHFRIVAGVASAGSAEEGSEVERVIEFESGAFRPVNRVLQAGRAARARLRAGDLLMSIAHQSSGACSRLAENNRRIAENNRRIAALKRRLGEPENADFAELEDADLTVTSPKFGTCENCSVCISGSIERVKPEWAHCVAGQDVIALRAKSKTVSPDVLVEFLHPTGLEWLPYPEQWLAEMTLAPSEREAILALKALSVPIVPDRVILTLQEWREMGEELSNYMAVDEPVDEILLTAQTQREFDRRTLKLKTEQYAFRYALAAADDLEFQIRNFYPFPISYPYRMLTAPAHHLELLEQRFAVVEDVLALIASITLAISKPPSARVRAFFDEGQRFESGLGRWKTIAMTAADELNSQNRDGLESQLKALWRGRFERNTERLVEIRNDKTHRGKQGGLSSLSEEARSLLEGSFEDLAFLIRFPIVRVFDPKVPRTGECEHPIHYYRGDHPAHERSTLKREKAVPASLYISFDEHLKDLRDLFPFVSVRECDCGESETFFLDKKSKGTWFVKSFEHSHPARAEDVAEGLRAWRS